MPSTSTSEDELAQPINEIERFLHLRRRIDELRAQMALNNNENRPLKDFAVPSEDEPHSSIVSPTIQANNFELKPSLLQIVQQNQFSAGGALMDKPFKEAYELIENMAQNHYQWGSERTPVEKTQPKGGMYEVSSFDHMNAKVDALTQKIDNLTVNPAATVAAVTPNCEICGVSGHNAANCQLLAEPTSNQVNYAQGNPHSNTYNPGWKNHPNLSYKNNNALFAPSTPPGYNQKAAPVAPNVPQKSNLELMMENFILAQTQQNKEFINQNIHTNELIKQLANKFDAMATHNKMLETQISQVAQQQAATSAPAGTFPGQPQPNPKGHANAVTLRNGKALEDPIEKKARDHDVGKSVENDLGNDSVTVDQGEASKAKEVVDQVKEKEILLGRPFLATAGAIIDVKRGKLTFEELLSEAPPTEEVDAILIEEEEEVDEETEISHILKCLDLTPNSTPEPEQPKIELKELPSSLRYEFLDANKEIDRLRPISHIQA
ncbi:hypothetical protein QL285_055218 [Trifolium repens]|nr:hypothetical protein QL285_055218 [Trifolium repens]